MSVQLQNVCIYTELTAQKRRLNVVELLMDVLRFIPCVEFLWQSLLWWL